MQKIYLDNAATTPLDSEVIKVMTEHLTHNFGNPSSTHEYGRKAKVVVETARKNIATYFNCSPLQVIFTAGGSEADNLILFNAVKNLGVRRIVSSPIEHHAVLHTIEALKASFGIELEYLKVDDNGEINIDELRDTLQNNTSKTLVSLMQVNNEIGNILKVDKICQVCKEQAALFHSDTVQAIGHVQLNLKDTPIDFMAASAHKFHGPKGVGFAIVNKEYPMQAMLHGGEQEMGSRAGTENTHSIAGMDKALSLIMDNYEKDSRYILELKKYFIEELKKRIEGIEFNGLSADLKSSAFHILNVRFPFEKPMMLFNLDLKGIAVSGGSACQSGSNKGSHVLQAILNEKEAKKTSVRFSFSKFNTKEEIDIVVAELEKIAST